MAAQHQIRNLTTLIKRLEAATSRLEDIASSTELAKDVPGLGQPVASSPSTSISTPLPVPQGDEEPLPESIEDFDVFLNTTVDKYVKLSNNLGGIIAQQAVEVLKGFQEQRKFLLISTKAVCPNPLGCSMAVYQKLLKPIKEALMAVTELKEANRPDPMYTQLSSVADGIMVLAWVTVENRPHDHVEECLSAAQFFGNRVLKEQKDKDPSQVEWIQSFYKIFRELGVYVKQHHASGLAWNPNGEPAEDVAQALSSPPIQVTLPAADSASIAAPPPPPPPPSGPPPILDIQAEFEPAPSASHGGLEAVFSELNKGESVIKGLRKVGKSGIAQKTPYLRGELTMPGTPVRTRSPAPGKKPKPKSMRLKKPANKLLEGHKWIVENFDKETLPVEIEASITHSVLISRCNNTTVLIKGKANQVTVENSDRLSLVVDTLVSTVDIVKANNFALQVLGKIPAVMMDQIDGAQIYFSKESSSARLFTSKCAGINLNVLSGPDNDYKEVPLPLQMCSYYDEEKGDLINEIVAHAG